MYKELTEDAAFFTFVQNAMCSEKITIHTTLNTPSSLWLMMLAASCYNACLSSVGKRKLITVNEKFLQRSVVDAVRRWRGWSPVADLKKLLMEDTLLLNDSGVVLNVLHFMKNIFFKTLISIGFTALILFANDFTLTTMMDGRDVLNFLHKRCDEIELNKSCNCNKNTNAHHTFQILFVKMMIIHWNRHINFLSFHYFELVYHIQSQ